MPAHKNDSTQFNEFFRWYITPPTERLEDELNLSAYATKSGITRRSLYTWTRSKAFRDMLQDYYDKNLLSITQRIKTVLANKALDETHEDNVKAIDLWMKYCSGITEKLELSGKVETGLSLADIQRIREKIVKGDETK